MLCIRNLRRSFISSAPVRLIPKARYSRDSDRNTISYEIIKTNEDALDDIDNTVFGANPNWELLAPRGFRFYLPGSIGPGWLDASTTAQVEVRSVLVPNNETLVDKLSNDEKTKKKGSKRERNFTILHCVAQQCPSLLRKGIMELFPGCLEVASPLLTIITISQNMNVRLSRWSKETETEKHAQHFVLAASHICRKLKLIGYWADFINPFSGQPYFNIQKSSDLYSTDERFRSTGFKIEQKTNCKIISQERNLSNFVGNLYTNAPANTEFLKEVMSDVKKH